MLTEAQIIVKLHRQADQFRSACARKEYKKARWYYQQAYWTAYFIEVDAKTWEELFGVRQERGVYEVTGEFPETMYLKACDAVHLAEKRQ